MRILVLWNPRRGVAPGDDADWAHAQVESLKECAGIAAIALHPTATAAARDPTPRGWCLEVRLAEGHPAHEVVRLRQFSDFLGRLRMFGMHPSVLAIEGRI